MAVCLSAGVAFPAAGALIAPAERALPAPGAVVLENFEGYENDSFPEKWRAMKEDARTIYHIEAENGNRFLRARADQKTVQIGLEHPIDPKSNSPRDSRTRDDRSSYGERINSVLSHTTKQRRSRVPLMP